MNSDIPIQRNDLRYIQCYDLKLGAGWFDFLVVVWGEEERGRCPGQQTHGLPTGQVSWKPFNS